MADVHSLWANKFGENDEKGGLEETRKGLDGKGGDLQIKCALLRVFPKTKGVGLVWFFLGFAIHLDGCFSNQKNKGNVFVCKNQFEKQRIDWFVEK